jgi:methylated-DNA-[protein]-cysteine S-methyltransferase
MVTDGAVIASGWTADATALLVPMPPARRPASWATSRELRAITDIVDGYFAGDIGAIDKVVVRQRSGAFTERAWQALRAVPPAVPVSYQDLAGLAGRPAAVRAAGRACGTNAVALFVPCHRVLRRDGGLGGFRWGLAVKQWLLDHETHEAREALR